MAVSRNKPRQPPFRTTGVRIEIVAVVRSPDGTCRADVEGEITRQFLEATRESGQSVNGIREAVIAAAVLALTRSLAGKPVLRTATATESLQNDTLVIRMDFEVVDPSGVPVVGDWSDCYEGPRPMRRSVEMLEVTTFGDTEPQFIPGPTRYVYGAAPLQFVTPADVDRIGPATKPPARYNKATREQIVKAMVDGQLDPMQAKTLLARLERQRAAPREREPVDRGYRPIKLDDD